MGKLKKVGISFGIVIGLFFALVIIVGITYEIEENESTTENLETKTEQPVTNSMTADERRKQLLQEWDDWENEKNITEQKESGEKLTTEELQTVIAGFQSYNESVKALQDMCVNVETEDDFRLLGLLISEYGDEFLENTSDYGTVRDKLMEEGYGDHTVLGPLMFQSEVLVDGMSTCMQILAWEFSS